MDRYGAPAEAEGDSSEELRNLSGAGSEGGEEVVGAFGVEDVLGAEPGALELADAVFHFGEMAGVVGVGVDNDLAAQLLGQAEVAVAEVEALGCGVVLDGHAQFGGAV